MRVPFYDVRRANAPHLPVLRAATAEVLEGGHLIDGPRLRRFEAEFAACCGTGHCVGVGNGLDALSLALRATGVAPGDEVIVPAFTFIASWFAVSGIGAVPVPVDVRPDGNINASRIAPAITARTRAIVPVHLYGRMADMAAISAIAAAHGLTVVEDAAQAHGAERGGRRAGSLGHAAAFSFYPTKNLGATGDGGAVTTDDPDVAHAVRLLRSYGSTEKYRHEAIGVNSRLDELQAAHLSAKLPALAAGNLARRSIARSYHAAFQGAGFPASAMPAMAASESVWHLYPIRVRDRAQVQAALAGVGVGTGIHYPCAPFDQPAYRGLHDPARFPVSAAIAATTLSLPIADYLTEEEAAIVASATSAHARAHAWLEDGQTEAD